MKPKVALCGQARSGTSMMMRMLEMGGLDIHYQDRQSKELKEIFRNPYGFFEGPCPSTRLSFKLFVPENIKYLESDYKIIYIEREEKEVEASYKEILSKKSDFRLFSKENYQKYKQEFEKLLSTRPYLYIKFDDVFANSTATAQKIADYINTEEFKFNIENAALAVDKSLYKKRT